MLFLNFEMPANLVNVLGYLSFKWVKLPNIIVIGFKFFSIKIENQDAPYGFAKRGKKTFLLVNAGVLLTVFIFVAQLPYLLSKAYIRWRKKKFMKIMSKSTHKS